MSQSTQSLIEAIVAGSDSSPTRHSSSSPREPYVPPPNDICIPSAETIRHLWERQRAAWLHFHEQRGRSQHTQRSYAYASLEWLGFLTTLRHANGQPVQPWEATADHVRLWQQHLMQAKALAPASVNQRLAACSSFYTYVIRTQELERDSLWSEGVEEAAVMVPMGKLHANPFSSQHVQRAQTQEYHQAQVLAPTDTARLLDYLDAHQHTLTGARNRALLLTFLLTGYRNHEVVSMQWGNIRPNRQQPGAWIYRWTGKDNKTQDDPFPGRVYQAIVHYLELSGRRPDALRPDDYLFIPQIIHNVANLKNVREVSGHLSAKSAVRLLRSVLRKAGIAKPERLRIYDLRHTFAHRFWQTNKNLEALRQRLHYESLSTTGIYARAVLDDPLDDYSEALYQQMRSNPGA